MNDPFNWWSVPAIIIPAAIAAPAYAAQYFTVEQAQRALFPQATAFVAQPVHLDAEDKRFIADYSKVSLRVDRQPVWRAETDGKLTFE